MIPSVSPLRSFDELRNSGWGRGIPPLTKGGIEKVEVFDHELSGFSRPHL